MVYVHTWYQSTVLNYYYDSRWVLRTNTRFRAQYPYPGTRSRLRIWKWYLGLCGTHCLKATLFCFSAQAPVLGHQV